MNDGVRRLWIAERTNQRTDALEAGQAETPRPARFDRFEVDVPVEPRQRLAERGSSRARHREQRRFGGNAELAGQAGTRLEKAGERRPAQEAARRERSDFSWPVRTRNQARRDPLEHDGLVDHAAPDVLTARQVVHDLEQDLLEDGPQAPGARAPQHRLLGDGFQGVFGQLELDVVELEHAAELLDEGVLGLDEDADERLLVETANCPDDRQATDELGDEAELEQVLGEDLHEDLALLAVLAVAHVGPKADAGRPMRFSMILSKPANAPPQTNRMFVVSIWMNSWWGCLRPPWGGTEAVVPSRILSSACWTPSPETSRVIEGFSVLRAILSISSM